MCPTVTLSAGAVRAISVEAAASADGRETGGILLGHDDGDTLTVVVAGGPGPKARRTRARFLRDLEHASALADDAYEADGSVWLGEWHTHPRGPVTPSDLDLRTYMSHLADDTLGFERFLSCIVLPCAEHGWAHVSLAAWIVTGIEVSSADVVLESEGPHA